MKKNLHRTFLFFGIMLISLGASIAQDGELILVTPSLDTFQCEVGNVNTFIFKYNYKLDGFDKQCDDIDPTSVSVVFENPEAVELVGGPSVQGCFLSLNFRCLDDTPLVFEICVSPLSPFQTEGDACYMVSPTAVPVEMVFFNGNIDNSKVVLNWQTASEINNEGFEVQKSKDGNFFSELGFVNSNRSSGIRNYRYVDNHPSKGVNYYRLKQLDYDGAFEYSEIITVRNVQTISPIIVFPNPIVQNEVATVYIDAEEETDASINVISMTGAVISRNDYRLASGQNKMRIDNSKLAQGMYIVSVKMNNEVYNKRLIIQ